MKLFTDKEAEIKLYQTSEDTPVPGFTPSKQYGNEFNNDYFHRAIYVQERGCYQSGF